MTIKVQWGNLSAHAHKVHSQYGEEGILAALLEAVGAPTHYLVDIGAGDGTALSNTRALLESGWHGARFDANYGKDVYCERITAENICDVLAKYNVPSEFDLLSLDIDGIDWWVLRSLLRVYSPRIFVCEINPALAENPPVAIGYNPAHTFASSDYFGASLGAFRLLGTAHGYTCVGVHEAINAFFVRAELLPHEAVAYPGPFTPRLSWPHDTRGLPWHLVTAEDLP